MVTYYSGRGTALGKPPNLTSCARIYAETGGTRQRSLFHVLHSFSLRCSQCGYCQGMGAIAAMLLSYFAPERAYASLVQLHDAYHMHDIFSPGFPGLLESIYVQERIVEQMMPAVYAAFKQHMVATTSYATKWYITLFANSIPYQTHLRLWDVFLLEGPDLFVIVATSIIWAYRGQCVHVSLNRKQTLNAHHRTHHVRVGKL